jgi:hypothetical protein
MNSSLIRRWRLVTLVGLILLCLSVALRFWASSAPQRIPAGRWTWQGVVDVVSAFALALFAIGLYTTANKLVTPPIRQVSSGVATLFPSLVLVGVWLGADQIRWWDVLLPGLAWRLYLVLQTLPAILALWLPHRAEADSPPQGGSTPTAD